MTENLITLAALILAIVLAVTDVRTGLMPNRVTLGALVLAIGARWTLQGSAGLGAAMLGIFVTGLIPFGLFLFTKGKAIGGGDVKALAALGALLGPTRGLEAEMLSFIILAVFVLIREAMRGKARALLLRSFALVVPIKQASSGHTETPDAPNSTLLSSTLLSSTLLSPAPSPEMLEVRFGPALGLGTLIVCASILSTRM